MRAFAFASTVVATAFSTLPGQALARDWQMLADQSSLAFTFRQMGSPITGRFASFTTDITFDPADLAAASVSAEFAIDSVDTGNAERDAGIVGADWFDSATYPTAQFASTDFAHQGGDDYMVMGELTIRDITETIELPLTIVVDGEQASASGTLELDRRTFEIGRGDWASDAAVGYDVILEIEVVAESAD